MVLVAVGPAAGNVTGLSVCMPSGFQKDVEPPPQSVADVERSQHKAPRHETMKLSRTVTIRQVHTKPRPHHKGQNL